LAALVVLACGIVAGCDAGAGDAGSIAGSSASSSRGATPSLTQAPSTPAGGTTTRSSASAPPASKAAPASAAGGPVIVIDPGHSVTVHSIDPATGLDVSDYENEPEMRDVFAVAELVRAQLTAAGYHVTFTKPTLDTPTSLGQRAAVANAAHAALALSIHDQAGSSGGIGFTQGNNTVYYQSVGDYRETPSGAKVYFTNAAVAALSKRYAQVFQAKRAVAQGAPVSLLGNTGYDLGTRGLPAGDIWLVQLLAHVPWVYNEAGGNSAGMVGLSPSDERRYAGGLVAAVEACVPLQH
jgi:N-acetylmuramoyl-L-alanine amidase